MAQNPHYLYYCWASWPTPRITQPVRSRPTSMTCKRNGAVKVAWRLLVRFSVRLQRRLNSDRKSFEIFLGLDAEKVCFASPWVELRRLLSESQSSSSERRRTHGTPKMNSWRFFEGLSTSAIVTSGGSRILKRGGGQEEAEGVSCRSECGCSRNAAALGRSASCLGGSGGMLPRNFLKIQLSKYAFLRILRVSTVCQAEGNMHPSSTPIVAYGKPDHSFYTRAHDCALLSIGKKIEARLKGGGGGHGPFAPPPPWIRHC